MFYYLTQSLAKWERGIELLKSCSKRQAQSACGYEVIRTITSQYSIVSRMEAVFVREQALKLYQHVGHIKRPTDLIRHLEDSFSKSEAKLSVPLRTPVVSLLPTGAASSSVLPQSPVAAFPNGGNELPQSSAAAFPNAQLSAQVQGLEQMMQQMVLQQQTFMQTMAASVQQQQQSF